MRVFIWGLVFWSGLAFGEVGGGVVVEIDERVEVNEGGIGEVVVGLSAVPTATISISLDAAGLPNTSNINGGSQLDFSIANWATSQTITITALVDTNAADEVGFIGYSIISGSAKLAIERTEVVIIDAEKNIAIPANSSISVNKTSLAADGQEVATITLRAKNSDGGNVEIGGGSVVFTIMGVVKTLKSVSYNNQMFRWNTITINTDPTKFSAILSDLVDNGDGSYSQNISSTKVGELIISAEFDGVKVTSGDQQIGFVFAERTLTFGSPPKTYKTIEPSNGTGRIWLDRNLGADAAATAYNHSESFGYLYQWGRNDDGHQFRNSETTTTVFDTITPSFAINPNANKFVLGNSWTTGFYEDLNKRSEYWSDGGVNDICPPGFEVPSLIELAAEVYNGTLDTASEEDVAIGKVFPALQLPEAGRRKRDGVIENNTTFYWVNNAEYDLESLSLIIFRENTLESNAFRGFANGFGASVRCIKTDEAIIVVKEQKPANFNPGIGIGSIIEGGQYTYYVSIDRQPIGNLTIEIVNTDKTALRVLSESLVFTPDNWETQQPVTIIAIEDDDAIDEGFNIVHTANGGGYGDLERVLTVFITDNDTKTVVVSPKNISVNEGGANTYTIVLTSAPDGIVTLTPISNNTDVANVSEAIIFNKFNWDMPQIVVVSTAEDDNSATETATIRHTIDGEYENIFVADVAVVTIDNDNPEVLFSLARITVAEGGATIYTAHLATEPSGVVEVTPISGNINAATVSGVLTFSADNNNWREPQDVTISGVDDDNTVHERFTITHTVSGADYQGLKVKGIMVTMADDDTAGVLIEPTAVEVMEGQTATYSIVLETEPAGVVRIIPNSAGLSFTALSFDAGTWDTVQFVTISGASDDDGADGGFSISHQVENYAASANEVMVTVLDDDLRGVRLATNTITVNENNSTTVGLRLATEPNGEVVVMASDNAALRTIAALTFTMDNWDTVQNLTISAIDDDNTIDEAFDLGFSFSGADYANLAADEVLGVKLGVIIDDDDTAEIIISSRQFNIMEGGQATWTIALTTEPATNVQIGVFSSVEAATTSGTLTWTVDSWRVIRTVTISAVEDDDAADVRATITHTVVGYAAGAGVVIVDIEDNDDADIVLSVEAGAILTVPEDGQADYSIRLATEPVDGVVTITPISGDISAAEVSGALTFDVNNWETPQFVIISGVDDGNAGVEDFVISHRIEGADYGAVADKVVQVVTNDNDTAGLEFISTTLGISEGAAVDYTIRLNTEPSERVTISIRSGAVAIIATATLTFDRTNWDTVQTVSISAIEDNNAVAEVVDISHSVSGYGVIIAATITATITENDAVGVRILPTAINIAEGASAGYGVVLLSEPTDRVMITPKSDHLAVVVGGSLTFTADDWDMTKSITVTAIDDDRTVIAGAKISHSVEGGDYADFAAGEVAVTVNNNDVAAIFASTTTVSIIEAGEATYTISIATEPSENVTITIDNTNPAVSITNEVVFTPAAWFVTKTITITATNDDIKASERLIIGHQISGADYAALTIPDITATTIDNDQVASIDLIVDIAADISPITRPNATYSISPALPDGLIFNTSSGTISGTPTMQIAARTYLITASHNSGTTILTTQIQVNSAAPKLAQPAATTFIAGTFASLTIDNSGGAATFSISPNLPDGLTIDPSYGIISGTARVKSALTTYEITAANITATKTVTIQITVNPSKPAIINAINLPEITREGNFQTLDLDQNFQSSGSTITYTVESSNPTTIRVSNPNNNILILTPGETPTTDFVDISIIARNSNGVLTTEIIRLNLSPAKSPAAPNLVIVNPTISSGSFSFTIIETANRSTSQTITITTTATVTAQTITKNTHSLSSFAANASHTFTVLITDTEQISIQITPSQSYNSPPHPTQIRKKSATGATNQASNNKNQKSAYIFTPQTYSTSAPQLLSATPIKNRKIKLQYSPSQTNTTSTTYNIYYTTQPPATPNLFDHQQANSTQTTYITPKLPIKPHFFIITSEDDSNIESPPSNQLQALPKK